MADKAWKQRERKVRAERKAGEMLRRLERGKGGQPTHTSLVRVESSEYHKVLEENKIPTMTAFRWQKLAEMPEDKFEKQKEKKRQAEIDKAFATVWQMIAVGLT